MMLDLRRNPLVTLIALLVTASAIGQGEVGETARPTHYRLTAAAGGVGGVWYQTMVSIGEVIQRSSNIDWRTVPGSSISNPVRISTGDVDVGWSLSDNFLAAMDGSEPHYDVAHEEFRLVATGWSTLFMHFSVKRDSEYESLSDIFESQRGVRIVTNSGSLPLLEEVIFPFYGVSISDIRRWGGDVLVLGYGDWPGLIRDGHADALFNSVAVPDPIMDQVGQHSPLRLLPFPADLSEYIEQEHNLTKGVIPAGTYYDDQPSMPTSTRQLSLLVGSHVPAEVVYELLEILDDNIDLVRRIHPTFSTFDLAAGWDTPGLPLHDGARQFYEERGYLE